MASRKPFRVLVTGSRTWEDEEIIQKVLAKVYKGIMKYQALEPILVHGTAPGADTMAAKAWIELGGTVEPHPADWDRFGKSAGYVRNAEMVNSGAEICLAFIKSESRGATACVKLAEKAGIRTWTITAD